MKTRFVALASALSISILSASVLAAATPVRTVDRVVAVVNKQVITELGLNDRLMAARANLQRQGIQLPPEAVLRQQVLERMITEEAQLQVADSMGIRVENTELDRLVERVAANNKLSLAAFRERLKKEKMSEARFREDIRREVILDRLREREVDSKISVSDSEVENYLKSAINADLTEYRIAHVLIPVSGSSSQAQVEAAAHRIEEASKKLQAGVPFSQVAATYSAARDGLSGGELGWRAASRVPPEWGPVLAQLSKGEYSQIIRSPAGFHIVKLLDKRSRSEGQLVEQLHARHILIKVNEGVSEASALKRLQQAEDRLKQGASFDDVARRFSEDGSASRGGDLGWVSPGDTVPEFERAMQGLALNQISAPVRSPFGWHLIQVTEKRSQNVGDERMKAQVRQELRQRKIEQATQEWQRQVRDAAHVDNKLNEQ